MADEYLLPVRRRQERIPHASDHCRRFIDRKVRAIEHAIGANLLHGSFEYPDPLDPRSRKLYAGVLVFGDDFDPGENVFAGAAEVRKDDGVFGEVLGQIPHLACIGVNLNYQVQLRGQLHHLCPFRRLVFVAGHVVAKFAEPDEAKLAMTLLYLSQRVVNAERSDNATSAESAFVTIYIFGHLTIPVAVIVRALGLVTPRRRDDSPPHAAFVQIGHEFRHIARDQVPLKVLAVVTGDVQMGIEDPAPRLGLRFNRQRLSKNEVSQRNYGALNEFPAMKIGHVDLLINRKHEKRLTRRNRHVLLAVHQVTDRISVDPSAGLEAPEWFARLGV